MSSSAAVVRRFKEILPAGIIKIEWNDPVLVLGGDGWTLALTSPWRIVATERLIIGSDDADQESLQEVLSGKKVVSCDTQSRHASLDMVLVLESGEILEMFSVAYLEPWTLSLSNVGVFVASPSE